MQFLKQSTAVTVKIGPFLDESDGKTAETGLTISQADVRLSKNGGDIAQKNEASACTHDELGIYGCPLDATDTGTLGRLQLWVHESGALPVWHEYMVVTANIYDSFCSTDLLQSDLTQIGGVAQSATDLKDFADTGYDPSTHKVQGVVLCDTTTTNTDMVTDVSADVTAIKAKTDNLPADPADDSDIDSQLSTIDTVVDAIKAKTDNLPADPASETNVDANETKIDTIDTVVDAIKAITDILTLTAIADAVLDEVTEGTTTLRHVAKIIMAVLAGKSSGGGTNTLKFRDVGDAKDRVTATVDANGNRSAMTLDAT